MIELHATARVSGALLQVRFHVKNVGDRPAFVFLLPTFGNGSPRPSGADTILHEATGRLLVSLMQPPVPPGLDVYAKVLPLSRYVRPGASAEGVVELPVPVREFQPYAPPEPTEPAPQLVHVQEIELATQYVVEGTTFFARPVPTLDGYFRASGNPAPRVSTIIRLPEPLPVLKRVDDFPRFA